MHLDTKIIGVKMKALIIFLSLLVSVSIYANDYEGDLLETQLFEELFSNSEKNNWATSSNVCQAYTVCPNGAQIYCRVFGYQYVSNGRFNNSCNWLVLPGRAVRCRGYQQMQTPYGYQWSWVDLPISCF